MDNKIPELQTHLHEFIEQIEESEFDYLSEKYGKKLKALVDAGIVRLKNDHDLHGTALEIRVRELFVSAGMSTQDGRPGREDLIVDENTTIDCHIPLVVEVKSRNKPQIELDYLRQLDDYVFELSKEQGIRHAGLNKWNSPHKTGGMALGAIQPLPVHPKRFKGVLVFNGKIGQPFTDRDPHWMTSDQVEFADSRHFCCMTLESLISWSNACKNEEAETLEFWKEIYETKGNMKSFSLP